MPRITNIQVRRGTATEWSTQNPVLDSGELGYDVTNKIYKIGDGTTAWNSLSNHNHSSTNISDSTTAGRALLTGADAAAQRTSLGLGSLATQSGTFSGTSSGTNTGNQTISISGDVTAAGSTGALTAAVTKINGVALSGLSTGLLKNTTTTGAPSIAIAGTDYAAASHTHTSSNITDFNTSVNSLISGTYAPLNNPTFAGIPSVPTATVGTNTNQIASTQFVTTALSSISSPTKTLAFFTPRDNQPTQGSFATLDTRPAGANSSLLVLEFDSAAIELSEFIGVINSNVSLTNGVIVNIWWVAATATTGTVFWGAQLEKTSGKDLDVDYFNTPPYTGIVGNTVVSTATATNGVEIIASVTISDVGSLVAGDRFRMRVFRLANDAVNDTMAGDAQLIAVELRAV